MIANDLEWALRHTNLCFLYHETLFTQGFRNIEVGDRTEQTAINAGFLRNLNGQATQLFTLRLCSIVQTEPKMEQSNLDPGSGWLPCRA